MLLSVMLLLVGGGSVAAQSRGTHSAIERSANGYRLMVDSAPFEVKGVVWSYTPIGENYTYDLWSEPESIIRENIDRDAALMKEIGVNAIRVFSDVPPKWITYLYRQHGIYTVVNPLFGRYGVSARGIWWPNTDYSDLYSRQAILDEALSAVELYKDVPGVLMFMFGNENNYGLEWQSNIIQDLPVGQQNEARAAYMYSLFEEAISQAKEIHPDTVYSLVNGDIQYLNLIEELVPSLDVLSVNTYRGVESGDLFYRAIAELDLPIVYAEFGADAYNALTKQEDQYHQAYFLFHQWLEIYQQAYGKGKSQNAIGGFVFQWMDEWWKHKQEADLDVHNPEGSWRNGGYFHDSAPGLNNMNEEWFGIIALSERKMNGVHRRIPRAAFYMLGELWELSLYDSTTQDIQEHFSSIQSGLHLARGESMGIREALAFKPISLDGFFLRFSASAELDDVAIEDDWRTNAELRSGQELGLTFGFEPYENFSGTAEMRFWRNPLLPAFLQHSAYATYYEYDSASGETDVNAMLYSAEFEYDNPAFLLEGFYRSGRPDWMLHGDPFNLKPEAWDRFNMDIAGSDAPFGLELQMKGALDGLRIAAGPELYWGAEPSVAVNYYNEFSLGNARADLGLMYREQLFETESAEPGKKAGRKASISSGFELMPYISLDAAVLHSGAEKIGEEYVYSRPTDEGQGYLNSDYLLFQGEIDYLDTLAGKVTVASEIFRYTRLYARYLYAGLVANAEPMIPRSGFQKADSGSGNRQEVNAGGRFVYGDFAAEGEVRWRKPLVGPFSPIGLYSNRNRIDDPFSVFWNRETIEGELVLTYDQEGATYFHDWNNKDRERSTVAGSLSLLYTYYQGPTDTGVFKSGEGDWYPFENGLPEAYHLWSAVARIVLNPLPGLRANVGGRIGHQQSTGQDERLVNYLGGDLALRYRRIMLDGSIDLNTWGPQTWHREFNLTYPMQWSVDLAYGFDIPSFYERTGRIGVNTTGRTFGEYSAGSEPEDGYQTITGLYLEISY
ncbi:hypothetical protein [Spirochaeta dissipatitropha]